MFSFPTYQLCDLASFSMEMFIVGCCKVCMCLRMSPCMCIYVRAREKEETRMNAWMGVRLWYFSLGFTCISHLCILAMVVTVTGMCRKVPKHHLGSFDGQVVKRNVVIILRENHS